MAEFVALIERFIDSPLFLVILVGAGIVFILAIVFIVFIFCWIVKQHKSMRW